MLANLSSWLVIRAGHSECSGGYVSGSEGAGKSERRLRIAFLVYRGNPHSGGQGVYTRYITRELFELGHHVEVFSGPPYPELDEGVILHKLPSLDLYRDPDPFRVPKMAEFRTRYDVGEFALMCTGAFPEPRSFGWRMYKAIRERLHDFDIIHDNQSLSHSVLRLQRLGMPVLASIHHPITVDRRLGLFHAKGMKERIGLWRFYGFLRMQTKVAQGLRSVLTVSHASATDISREMGVDPKRIKVAPVGVDTTLYRPIEHVVRERGLIVTTASADVPLKGLKYLIEAVHSLVEDSGYDCRLVVMGKRKPGSTVAELVEYYGLGDRVSFVGSVSCQEMVEYYSRASVAVVPSLYEGFSLPSIEAMACGTPLVVTNGGALPEVVGRESRAAKVAIAGDAVDLAGKMLEVLLDPQEAQKMARRAMLRVHSRYSWKASALATEKAYFELLASRDRATTAIDLIDEPQIPGKEAV